VEKIGLTDSSSDIPHIQEGLDGFALEPVVHSRSRWHSLLDLKNFKTPLLVTHGELDYRAQMDQSLQLLTALQRMGVESKLLLFPD